MKAWMQAQYKECLEIIGGLSNPSKMPCFGYSIPAQACRIGSMLRKVKGSVCSSCYALKGRYVFGNVLKALTRRLNTLNNPAWIESFAFVLNHLADTKGERFFRWHDSGDLQGMEHLVKIIRVAQLTSAIKHWLPTREHTLIRQYLENGGVIPKNLTIRLSSHLIGGPLPKLNNLPVSTVHDTTPEKDAFVCKAYKQDGKCEACRACWSKKVHCVSYPKH